MDGGAPTEGSGKAKAGKGLQKCKRFSSGKRTKPELLAWEGRDAHGGEGIGHL